MKFRLIGSGFLFGAVLFFPLFFAHAGTGLTIQPVKVSHTLEPGESISGVISLANASEEKVKVEVKVEDFVPMAGTYNNIQFVGRTSGVTTVRDWVRLDAPASFLFEQGASRAVPYTITAPKDAEPGSHFGVAFFKALRLNEEGQFKIGTQVGMLLFITIPGSHLQKGEVRNFDAPLFVQKGPIMFKVTFENTGTVHFEPKGMIMITNMFGKKVGEVPISGQAVLPTAVKDLVASFEAGILLGRYSAALTIADGEGNLLTADRVSFYAFPLFYLLGFIALTFALFYLYKFLRRRVKFSVSLK